MSAFLEGAGESELGEQQQGIWKQGRAGQGGGGGGRAGLGKAGLRQAELKTNLVGGLQHCRHVLGSQSSQGEDEQNCIRTPSCRHLALSD